MKKDKAPSFIEKTVKTFSGWMNWLAESGQKYIIKPITSTLKNIKKNIKKIFEKEEFKLKEGQSALKNFVREYIIDGNLVMIHKHFLNQSEA